MLAISSRMDVHLSQATFRVLLSTLSRPGRVERLPRPADGPSAIPLALADLDTPVAVIGPEERRQEIVLATGAPLVALEQAALVACWQAPTAGQIAELPIGSALVPERGAKVGLACSTLVPEGAALAGDEPTPDHLVRLELIGPGVDGRTRLGVAGLSAEVFTALAERNRDFPAGIDVWLVDASGSIAALSRSSTIEVI